MSNVKFYNCETTNEQRAAWVALHAAGWKHHSKKDMEQWIKTNSKMKSIYLDSKNKIFLEDTWKPDSISKGEFFDLLFKQAEPEPRSVQIGPYAVKIGPRSIYMQNLSGMDICFSPSELDQLVEEWTKYKEVHKLVLVKIAPKAPRRCVIVLCVLPNLIR